MASIPELRRMMGPAKKRLRDLLDDLKSREGNIGASEARILKNKLTSRTTRFESYKDRIRDLAKDDESEINRLVDEGEEYAEIMGDIDDVMVLLSDAIHLETVTAQTSENRQLDFVPNPAPSVKLQTLTLGKFGGNVLHWTSFWDSYSSSIHENPKLSPVDKLNYLKSLLTDDALLTIEGLPLTNDNYDIAISLLKNRFSNKTIIVDRYYSELRNLKSSNYDLRQLRFTFDNIERILRCLKALGEDIEQTSLAPLIRSKFPSGILLKVEEKLSENHTTSELREALQIIISMREKISIMSNETPTSSNVSLPQNKREKTRATAEALTIKEIKCFFCKDCHWTDECPKYPTIDSRKEKIKGKCFVCFKDHLVKACPNKRKCAHCNKIGSHHRSLCFKNPFLTTGKDSTRNTDTTEVNAVNVNEEVIMQTATVQCINSSTNQKTDARLFFDCGSQRSYVTKQFVKLLKLKSFGNEELSVFQFGSKNPKMITTTYVKFDIKTINGAKITIVASVVPRILGKGITRNDIYNKLKEKYSELTFADNDVHKTGQTINVLIGNDYYFDFLKLNKFEVGTGLYLVESEVGWVLAGRKQNNSARTDTISFLTMSDEDWSDADIFVKPDPPLMKQESLDMKKLWDLETLGIKDDPIVNDDDKAIYKFNESIKFDNGRYSVSWPWREYPPDLKDNYSLALGRLKSLMNKLRVNPDVFNQYNNTILDQLSKNVIEKVTEQSYIAKVIHYLPHHAVITPEKTTTKLRIVYDASAKLTKKDKSLNECLLRGRILLEDLCGMLLRFRVSKYVSVSDIEKAFLQIGLNDDSKDATRFLWLNDINKPLSKDNLIVFRFTRVAFGLVSSPFLLSGVVKHHLLKYNSQLATQIANNVYVDNVIIGYDKEEEGPTIYDDAKSIFREASMNLREWSANSTLLQSHVARSDLCKDGIVKVLGILWDTESDSINLRKRPNVDLEIRWTKRKVLKFISTLFDPLGYFCPTTLLGRVFLKKLWTQNIGWDEYIDNHNSEWLKVYNQISGDNPWIQRHLGYDREVKSVELHCFTDASKEAYAAVAYIRLVFSDSKSKTNLLFAKNRLSPANKNITIPRLELLGVLIGSRIIKFIKDNISIRIDDLFLWTDSKCVLNWLAGSKLLPLFIERRITEIRAVESVNFNFISGTDNPADMATRGMSLDELSACRLWWKGPEWLETDKVFWPKSDGYVCTEQLVAPEELIATQVQPDKSRSRQLYPPFAMDESRYSSLQKLFRVTSYCVKFIRLKFIKPIGKNKLNWFCSKSELDQAKYLWDKYIQSKCYQSVIESIMTKGMNELQKQLGLWLDEDNLLRCSGRLSNAEIADESKYPKLIPKNEHYTKLIVESYHKRLFHVGTAHTLSQIRKEYWIPQGRAYVYKIIKSCLSCRRIDGGPYRLPAMPPLPKYRVKRESPFCNVGVDYIGPFYTSERGFPTQQKVWACLYTCLVTRAIHLEILRDMTGEEFILCLRRFVARRGLPKLIISDNSGQFKMGKVVFHKAWDSVLKHKLVATYSVESNIGWKFIPEYSPWMGGVYERLIGLLKRCIRKTLGKSQLSASQVMTILTEMESILNSRPLVYVTSDGPGDEVLTPSHFLNVNSFDQKMTSCKANLLDGWKKGRNLLSSFWKLWREEYLASLRERTKIKIPQSAPTQAYIPQVGDVVQVHDRSPRIKWKLGKIIKTHKSEDGKLRSASLLLGNGHTITRSISHLYPLEVELGERTENQGGKKEIGAGSVAEGSAN